eukprot:gene7056-7270_t
MASKAAADEAAVMPRSMRQIMAIKERAQEQSKQGSSKQRKRRWVRVDGVKELAEDFVQLENAAAGLESNLEPTTDETMGSSDEDSEADTV